VNNVPRKMRLTYNFNRKELAMKRLFLFFSVFLGILAAVSMASAITLQNGAYEGKYNNLEGFF
jgi:hypothetical protein